VVFAWGLASGVFLPGELTGVAGLDLDGGEMPGFWSVRVIPGVSGREESRRVMPVMLERWIPTRWVNRPGRGLFVFR